MSIKKDIVLLDLFSGLGGFHLAVKRAGFNVVKSYHFDIEEYPNNIYIKRFPSSIAKNDITKIDWNDIKQEIKGIDADLVITGGFPCQDISTAGHQKGMIDEDGKITRSGLWFEAAKAIKELGPEWCLFENVGGLITNGLDNVLLSLKKIGYNCDWQIISALNVGALHQRRRIWITAYRDEKPLNVSIIKDMDKNDYKYLEPHIVKHWGRITESNTFHKELDLLEPESHKLFNRGMMLNGEIYSMLNNYMNGLAEYPTLVSGEGPGSMMFKLYDFVFLKLGIKPQYYKGNLDDIYAKYPTLTKSDYRIRWKTVNWLGNDLQSFINGDKPPPKGYNINPEFCEWLMGYDYDYTNIQMENIRSFEGWKKDSYDLGELPYICLQKENTIKRIQSLGNSIVPQCATAAIAPIYNMVLNGNK